MIRACLLAVITACSYTPPSDQAPTDTPGQDAPSDTPPAVRCFGTFKRVCIENPPTEAFTLGGASNSVITEMPGNCAATTIDSTVASSCVLVGSSVTIDGSLTASGGLPLVVVATDGELIVEELLDVSSRRGAERRGAGANPTGACNGATVATEAAGGAGGSFGGKGGTGGRGVASNEPAAAPTSAFPDQLRGGCPGNLGGRPTNAVAVGSGGGAIWLISTVGITINGTINASGAGGSGADGDVVLDRGGAGGGSGGMIILDAPTITIAQDGVVLAAGGGGGGGNAGILTGDDGENPDPGDPGTPAPGGLGNLGFGGNGGLSGDGETGDTNLGASGCGGGGGTGFIRAFGTLSTSGTVFPPIPAN